MDIKTILARAIKQLSSLKIDSPQLDAELLLLQAISPLTKREIKKRSKSLSLTAVAGCQALIGKQKGKAWLYSHLTDELDKTTEKKFASYINRRLTGEPVAYITNSKQFYNLDFYVDERVLVPRPETELLVTESLKLTAQLKQPAVIIDVGTGSGAIIISLAKHYKSPQFKSNNLKLIATDISPAALAVAKINADMYKVLGNIEFHQGSLLEPIINNLSLKQYSNLLITANLPYLSQEEYMANENNLEHEPKLALIADDQGLSLIGKLLDQASKLSNNTITIILEHGYTQTNAICDIAIKLMPKAKISTKKDLANLDRITLIHILNNI